MKYHLGFLTVLASVLAALAYLAFTLNERDLFYFHDAHDDMTKALTVFRDSRPPITEINFTQLYGESEQFQVLHPLLDMRVLHFEPGAFTCGGVSGHDPKQEDYLGTYRGAPISYHGLSLDGAMWTGENEYNAKRVALENYFNEGIALPDDFILTPPFVDTLGYSYAFYLSEKDVAPYASKNWVEEHLSFFKVSELRAVLSKYQITHSPFVYISRFSETEIEEIIRGAPAIVTKDYLLMKNQSRLGFSPLSYWVYDVRELYADLKNGPYELAPASDDAFCIQRDGNLCWTYNSRHVLGYLYRYMVAVLALLAVVFLGFLCTYLKFLFDKGREQRRHHLALQVLSHEFRTPVSAMLLLIEQLASNQTALSPQDQDLVTRMSGEAFRLQRIIEVSRTYLQAESRRIPFNFVALPSLNAWVLDFAAEFGRELKVVELESDRALKADPFWLKFVLSTLVQNAFAHGKEPVNIRLSQRQNAVCIAVEDDGDCPFGTIQQMADPFVKSPRSQGMGLGLNIAKFIVREWGSEISFSKNPTSFSLSLRAES